MAAHTGVAPFVQNWYRYLRTLLTLPGPGWNIRNDRLHGLSDHDVALTVAAPVLVRILYLAVHVEVAPGERPSQGK